ncbi:MAG TPA: hypothetical protein DD706_14370 [Nitrospiraceae bacterium]|nr:hypothetical protein [Nitrospiraceae bacterium]
MTKGPRKYDEELRALFEELAEIEAQSSDDEILAMAQEDGENPQLAAQQIRNLFQNKVKAYQQRALHAAQEKYRQQIQSLYQNSFKLPKSIQEKRNLLVRVFSLEPDMEAALLTAQHREFKNLTNEDIEGYLNQLLELGVLDQEGLVDEKEGK